MGTDTKGYIQTPHNQSAEEFGKIIDAVRIEFRNVVNKTAVENYPSLSTVDIQRLFMGDDRKFSVPTFWKQANFMGGRFSASLIFRISDVNWRVFVASGITDEEPFERCIVMMTGKSQESVNVLSTVLSEIKSDFGVQVAIEPDDSIEEWEML